MSEVPVPIAHTQRFELQSTEIEETFFLDVQLPTTESKQPLPVIYVTDGNLMFPLVANTVRLLQMNQELKDVLVVGIGYKEEHEVMTLRSRDLTPTQDPNYAELVATEGFAAADEVLMGGADKFLNFINNDVKSFIKSRFNVSDDATLAGYSLGGLFTLHTLFTATDSFSRYLAASPSLWWEDKMMREVENEYAKRFLQGKVRLDASVFISIGGHEEPQGEKAHWARMVHNMHEFVRQMQTRNYKGLSLTHHEFPEETHASVVPAAISRGLRALF